MNVAVPAPARPPAAGRGASAVRDGRGGSIAGCLLPRAGPGGGARGAFRRLLLGVTSSGCQPYAPDQHQRCRALEVACGRINAVSTSEQRDNRAKSLKTRSQIANRNDHHSPASPLRAFTKQRSGPRLCWAVTASVCQPPPLLIPRRCQCHQPPTGQPHTTGGAHGWGCPSADRARARQTRDHARPGGLPAAVACCREGGVRMPSWRRCTAGRGMPVPSAAPPWGGTPSDAPRASARHARSRAREASQAVQGSRRRCWS